MVSIEEYLFDACGYVRRESYCSASEVAALTAEMVPHWEETRSIGIHRVRNLLQISARFAELANRLPRDLLIRRYINQPYRLIESYALSRSAGSSQELHNGMSEFRGSGVERRSRTMWRHHTYHDGRIYCMMVKILLYLTDITSLEDGPFCWVEGSHKSSFAIPLNGDELASAQDAQRLSNLRTAEVRCGDVIVLNEALMHGTLAKMSEKPRIVLAFSYAPSFVADYAETSIESASALIAPAFYV